MLMHYSLYNYCTQLPEGGWALFNFRTGKLVKLNEWTKYLFDTALERPSDDPEILKLKERGFLVDFDEKKHLKTLTRLSCGRTDELALVICPTFACNFACPYCFEHERPGKMSEETQEQVLGFMERQFELTKPRRLSISWFGGEPLLFPDVIEDLTKRIIPFCEEKNLEYRAGIVTNGWFLTQENVDLLERCRVSEAQITIDGPTAEVHDRTRYLKNGGPTFDRIIENLKTIRTSMILNIRCNVQKDNIKDYPVLKEMIGEIRESTGNKVYAYAGYMDGFISTKEQESSLKQQIEGHDYYTMMHPGREDKHIMRFRGTNCISQEANGFAIDEKGNMYKCWENIGVDSERFGHVSTFGYLDEPDAHIEVLDAYAGTVWPEEDSECMDCIILPYCLGGCPHRRIATGKHKCFPQKFALDEYVIARCNTAFKKKTDNV